MSEFDELENPIARDDDPDTSHLAADKITKDGSRGERAQQILSIVCMLPGSTGGEIGAGMYSTFPEIGMKSAVTSPSKRLADLEEAGLVRRGDRRPCTDTKMTCITWYATDKGIDVFSKSTLGDLHGKKVDRPGSSQSSLF